MPNGTCGELLKGVYNLQLGLGALGLLQNRLHLSRLHDVALDLQLAAHEQTLGVGLSSNKLGEVGIGEVEGDYDQMELVRAREAYGSGKETHRQPCRPGEQDRVRPRPCS